MWQLPPPGWPFMIVPHPLCLTNLGGQFTLPREVLVSYSDITAGREAELLADRLRNRLLLAVTVIDGEVRFGNTVGGLLFDCCLDVCACCEYDSIILTSYGVTVHDKRPTSRRAGRE